MLTQLRMFWQMAHIDSRAIVLFVCLFTHPENIHKPIFGDNRAQIWFCCGPQTEPDNNYKTIEPIKLRLLKTAKTILLVIFFQKHNKNKRKIESAREKQKRKPQWRPMASEFYDETKRNSICHMTIYVSAFSLRKHFHMQILMTFTFTSYAKKAFNCRGTTGMQGDL